MLIRSILVLKLFIALSICMNVMGKTYYVDINGIGGRSSDSNKGTKSSPWSTARKGLVSARPGDTVYFRKGMYRVTQQRSDIAKGATKNNRIVFSGYPEETVVISAMRLRNKKKFWKREKGQIYSTRLTPSRKSSSRFSVRRIPNVSQQGIPLKLMTFYDDNGGSQDLKGPGQWARNVKTRKIYVWAKGGGNPGNYRTEISEFPSGGSEIIHLGANRKNDDDEADYLTFKNLTFEGGYYPINVETDHVKIQNCTFRNCYADGIKIGGHTKPRDPLNPNDSSDPYYFNSEHGLIENCNIYRFGEAGIDLTGGDNWIIRNNRIHDNTPNRGDLMGPGNPTGTKGTGIMMKNNTIGALVEGNEIYNLVNNSMGAITIGGNTEVLGGVVHAIVQNNRIHNVIGPYVVLFQGAHDSEFVNNVIENCRLTRHIVRIRATSNNPVFRNKNCKMINNHFFSNKVNNNGHADQIHIYGDSFDNFEIDGNSLDPKKTYFYRGKRHSLRKFRNFGFEKDIKFSSTSKIAPSSTETMLLGPSDLVADVSASATIKLTWEDNSDDESNFRIQRRKGKGPFHKIARVNANTTSYIDSDLEFRTTYSYRIRAETPQKNSDYSKIVTKTTRGVKISLARAKPRAPSKLRADITASQTIEFKWKDNSKNETKFRLQRKKWRGSFRTIAVIESDTTFYKDSGLNLNTTYLYRIRAENPSGSSPYSQIVTKTTRGGGSSSAREKPDAPSRLRADIIASAVINFTWIDNSQNETSFRLERKEGPGSFRTIARTAAKATFYQDSDLDFNTTYRYRVRAENSVGGSPFSNILTKTTRSGGRKKTPSSSSKSQLVISNNKNALSKSEISTPQMAVSGFSLGTTSNPDTVGPKSEDNSVLWTLYEDGEDESTDGWFQYNEGTIENIKGGAGGSARAIKITSQLQDDVFRLGNEDGSYWNNSTEFFAEFSLALEHPGAGVVYFQLDTDVGAKYIVYTDTKFTEKKNSDLIHVDIGHVADGQWHLIFRNLKEDLRAVFPDAEIRSVEGLYVYGSIKLDDIGLLDSNPQIN